MTEENKNPWTPEDEKEHFPSKMEWWCAIAFLNSNEDNKKWSFKITFAEWLESFKKPGSLLNMTLFDLDTNKHTISYSRNNYKKLKSAKDRLDIRYNDSYVKGSYPNYKLYVNSKKKDIKVNINYHAEAIPHWVAQNITNGWLPMGLGLYRYGFIPKCNLFGKIHINDKTYLCNGKGYFEHVWGNFWYNDPFSNVSELKKTISIYAHLIGWWIRNHRLCIPKSIMFSTDNNPFGYDWAWALFDNGWMIFYGNIMFWIMEGPLVGSLILSKDGKRYIEFSTANFRYIKQHYAKEYDFFYPSELEVIAFRGKEKLQLKFKMTADSREYVSRFSDGKYWLGFVICEAPGIVEGYYFDGEKKIHLTGVCRMEPQRQVSILGHNSLKIECISPPEGIGVSLDLESHILQKKISTKIQLAPHPKLKFNLKRIDSSKINKIKNE